MKHPTSSAVRPLSLLLAAMLAACGGGGDGAATNAGSNGGGGVVDVGSGSGGGGGGGGVAASRYSAEIRRTEMGVPHIKASTWSGAGYGYGYAQAEDNLCTMADSFLTYRGERSRYFGGEAQAVYDSTIGQPRNIDSDFFHRHVLSSDVVDAMVAAQPRTLRELVDGFAAGYNRYVGEVKAGTGGAHAACRSASWVQAITTQDIWRRMVAANLAGGYSNFVAAIANAAPPTAAPGSGGTASAKPAVGDAVAAFDPAATRTPHLEVGGTQGVGSNMYGFGSAVTGEGSSVLFGNPHWYWKGPDRFYQAQLTVPGELNVSGASFLGAPVVLIGFNDNVAWSHTVSTARRFGFFELKLMPGDPTRYQRDGAGVKMTARPITVQVRNAAGSTDAVTRTLYTSEYGPLVNLAALNPALAWSGTTAFAIRDINGENYRTFRTWLRWNQAKSLDEFIAIQREESAIPWVNTAAVGRGQAKVWYADMGAVPNVSTTQVATCTTAFGKAVAAALPNVPFFDGSRSACDWQTDADSVQKGAIGPARMPSLLREDYVGNMNDSYWSTNVRAPLVGFPAIFGAAGTEPLSLRTRLGHQMVLERLAGTDGYAGRQATSDIVRQMALNGRVYSAERFKTQALDLVCTTPQIALAGGGTVDVAAACAALRAWDNTGNATARGSHLWDEFWIAKRLTDAQLYAVPFDPADPVNTPRDLRADAAGALRQAFATAVRKVAASGFAVDAQRGDILYATRGDGRIPLFGGCGEIGYFAVSCSKNTIDQGGYNMDGQPHGNSYLQVVSFPGNAVQAYTFLTFSLSDDPASPHYGDYTRRYATKQWLRLPFTEPEITSSPSYTTTTLSE